MSVFLSPTSPRKAEFKRLETQRSVIEKRGPISELRAVARFYVLGFLIPNIPEAIQASN
jgi:hypothetical protein